MRQQKQAPFLPNAQPAANVKPMGKPPLPMTIRPTKVQLSEELIAAIDGLVGTYRRSRFIREAIEEKIARERAKP